MFQKPVREAKKRRPKKESLAEQGARSGQQAAQQIIAKLDPKAFKHLR